MRKMALHRRRGNNSEKARSPNLTVDCSLGTRWKPAEGEQHCKAPATAHSVWFPLNQTRPCLSRAFPQARTTRPPTKIDHRKKGYPYSNLSTGGPRQPGHGFSCRSGFSSSINCCAETLAWPNALDLLFAMRATQATAALSSSASPNDVVFFG